MLGSIKKGWRWNENETENNLYLFGPLMKVGQNENGAKNIMGSVVKVFILNVR